MAQYIPPYMQPYGYPMQPVQMQQPMTQAVQMAPQAQQGNAQSLVRVQGENAAKAWFVAPGCSVPMMDIEAPYLYIKSVGTDGVPFPLRKFRVTEEGTTMQTDDVPQWRAEIDRINARLDKLEGGRTDEPNP